MSRCWAAVVMTALAVFFLNYWELLREPDARAAGAATEYSILSIIVTVLGQAIWISLDLRRRGREIGWWRFGSVFLGPFVIAAYLIVAYRWRALIFVPLMVFVYGAAILGPELATGRLLK